MWRKLVDACKDFKEVVGAITLAGTAGATLLARGSTLAPTTRWILLGASVVVVLIGVIAWQARKLRTSNTKLIADGTQKGSGEDRVRLLEERLSGRIWSPGRALRVEIEAVDQGPTFAVESDSVVKLKFHYAVWNVGPFPVRVPQVSMTIHGHGDGFAFEEPYEKLTGWPRMDPGTMQVLVVERSIATPAKKTVGTCARLGVVGFIVASSDEWDGDQQLNAGGWAHGRVLDRRPARPG